MFQSFLSVFLHDGQHCWVGWNGSIRAEPCRAVYGWWGEGVNSKIWAPSFGGHPQNIFRNFSENKTSKNFPNTSLRYSGLKILLQTFSTLIFNTFRNSSIPGPPLGKLGPLFYFSPPPHPPVVPALYSGIILINYRNVNRKVQTNCLKLLDTESSQLKYDQLHLI
jgi:hypothetical protein